jgi:ABC-type dipeptide/oligopeptide/nickel transport system ATPase component
VPNLAEPIAGCPFRPRCAHAFAPCVQMPAPTAVPGDRPHAVRCWYVEERLRAGAEDARVE